MNRNTPKPEHIKEILSQFNIEGTIVEVTPFGSGHINDTYLLRNESENLPDYLLQRINHAIFTDVPGLMNNVLLVTNHLKTKLSEKIDSNPEKEVLTIVKLKNGSLYYNDSNGDYWRIYHYIPNTKSYDILENEEQAYEGGKAFGRFQLLLADLNASLLIETIPNFHNIEMRLNRFNDAVKADVVGRKEEVLQEIKFINERVDQMKSILNLGKAGKLPLRITHNDTKFNNVLLDKNDKVQCVIDLDTVMPGYVAYDFGDAIRTIINSASEDEKDLDKIKLNIPLFESYTKGYFTEAEQFLTPLEVESLMMGVLLFPYMQAVRFLTDYLEGDTYYKTHFEGHNLQRTKAQLQLLKEIEANKSQLQNIIEQVSKLSQHFVS
ncbi:phosphotransferase enzyme family protein [Solitalea lacus]|uniref:phosphotransferase enzyme family protein n=1 Tax=Solitalea lacus TaxID=2911172 RepID=UPI001ED9D26D|nr:aminoglycoside phosphotransferase family protein [Solitalea lacus]UKJ06831.1 aminoglycoside phosphotransferase family protein [Solitalea lacus]